jgi:hypothetical protein
VRHDPPHVLAVKARGLLVGAGQGSILTMICALATMQHRIVGGILLVRIVQNCFFQSICCPNTIMPSSRAPKQR